VPVGTQVDDIFRDDSHRVFPDPGDHMNVLLPPQVSRVIGHDGIEGSISPGSAAHSSMGLVLPLGCRAGFFQVTSRWFLPIRLPFLQSRTLWRA
jgi:hypothetical protein